MDYTRNLASIACLNVVMGQDKTDFIEAFVPLICELIRKNLFDGTEISKICKNIKNEFGLTVPYHAMQSILTRCKLRKIIRQEGNVIIVNEEKHWTDKYIIDIYEEKKVILNLCEYFILFSKEEYKENYEIESASKVIIGFLNSFDIELIISLADESDIPQFSIKNRDKYIFSQFVNHIKEQKIDMFNYLMKLAMGNIFSYMICYENQDSFIGKLKNVDVYLDTPLLIKLAGIEGPEKGEAFQELIKLIKVHGGKLKIFDHTNDETSRILNDCLCWIDNPSYNPELASDAIRFFVDNRYTQDEVRLFISRLSSLLRNLDIEPFVYINPEDFKEYQIDEKYLFAIIADSYHLANYAYEDWKKRNVIDKDVTSISNIYRLWKGHYPSSIQNARAIFLSTNGSLVNACEKFEKKVLKNTPKVYPCYNDVFIGTMLWLQSPSQIENIQRIEFLSYCMTQLNPTQEIVRKFVSQLKRLKTLGRLTDEEFYYLRSDKAVFDYIAKVTTNDENLFYDKIPEEILESIKNKVRNEEKKKTESVEGKLHVVTNEKEEIEKSYTNMASKLEMILDKVSSTISWFVFILFFIISAIIIFSVNSTSNIIRIISSIVSGVIALSGIGFGFNLFNFRYKIRNKVYKNLLDIFLQS